MGALLIAACPVLIAAGVFLTHYHTLTYFKSDVAECAVLALAALCFTSAPIVIVVGIALLGFK